MKLRPLMLIALSLLLVPLAGNTAAADPSQPTTAREAQPQMTAARSSTDALGTLIAEINSLSIEAHELSRLSPAEQTQEQRQRLSELSHALARKSTILQARVNELRRLVERLEQLGNHLESEAARAQQSTP